MLPAPVVQPFEPGFDHTAVEFSETAVVARYPVVGIVALELLAYRLVLLAELHMPVFSHPFF